MIPELGSYRIGNRADAGFAAGVLKLLTHLPGAEPPEVAAARFAGASRVSSCHFLEPCALLDLLLYSPGKGLVFYQDMACFPFHAVRSLKEPCTGPLYSKCPGIIAAFFGA